MTADNIQLIHGDCLVEMQKIPDKSIDFICADLPYEVLNKGNKNAHWDRMLPMDELWAQYERIIKDNGAIVLFAQGMFTARLMMSNPKLWRYNLIWHKLGHVSGFLNARRMPLREHEDICIFYKKFPTYNPQMVKCLPHQRNHSRGKQSKDQTNRCYGGYGKAEDIITDLKYPRSILNFARPHPPIHPTQKPVALIEWLIKTYTNEGELILDNTAGSMTTAVAALNTNRRCICIEKDDEIFSVGEERVMKHIKELKSRLF